jgi:flagellar hook-associated protein 2
MASALTGLGSTITVNGSAIDLNSMIGSLMAVERAPLDALNRRTQSVQAEISALGTLNSVLSSLQSASQKVSDLGTADPVTTASSDVAVASASSQGGAAPGNYSLTVNTLAQSEKVYSAAFASESASVGAGTLVIERGGMSQGAFTPKAGTSAISITIDPAKSSLADVRDAINNASAGITASVVNDGSGYRLVLSSKEPGAQNGLRITTLDGDGNNTDAGGLSQIAYDPAASEGSGRNMTQAMAPTDASFVLDGIPMTRPFNSISDVLGNLTINLNKTGSANLSVTRDVATSSTNAGAVVTAYNKVFSTLKSLGGYNTATQTGGPLFGESIVQDVQSRLRGMVNTQWGSATTAYRTLSSIGIRFGKDGTLAMDNSKFSNAMNADPAAAGAVLKSFGKAVSELLSSKLASEGPLASRTSGLQSSVQRLSDRQTQMEARMTAVEARYRAQFTSLQTALNSMSSTSSYLTSQFSSKDKD